MTDNNGVKLTVQEVNNEDNTTGSVQALPKKRLKSRKC